MGGRPVQWSRTVLALVVALMVSAGRSPNHALADTAQAASGQTIHPFKAHIPDAVLADLRRRLEMAQWPDQLPGTTWENGADLSEMRSLASYWQKTYDWRAQEGRINRFDQFTTEIDGQRIHFIHQRSPRAV